MTDIYISTSPEQTECIGERLIGSAPDIRVIAMSGGLGSGKTAMTRGIARALGCTDSVSSPTYTVVNEYRGVRKLCHFDLYRISSPEELFEIGWDDYLQSGALCVVEWSENAIAAMPEDTVYVHFSYISEASRQIKIESGGAENEDTCN